MQIQVQKADHTTEPFQHTKVLATFHLALSLSGQGDLYTAEQLAEAVTFYVYRRAERQVASEEICLMVLAILRDTGCGRAAEVLNRHRLERQLQRKRIEVLYGQNGSTVTAAWDKSRLVEELMRAFRLARPMARVIAGSVEEKVLRMGITRVSRGLLNELIAADCEAMRRAEEQLQAV